MPNARTERRVAEEQEDIKKKLLAEIRQECEMIKIVPKEKFYPSGRILAGYVNGMPVYKNILSRRRSTVEVEVEEQIQQITNGRKK